MTQVAVTVASHPVRDPDVRIRLAQDTRVQARLVRIRRLQTQSEARVDVYARRGQK